MSWKVLITARTLNEVGGSAMKLLRDQSCEAIIPPKFGPHPAETLQPLLEGVDAVLASMDKFTAEVLSSKAASDLKIISRWGVGYDAIDVAAATAQGIVVAYTPGFLNETVADFAFALLLALARRIHLGHLSMAAGQWQAAWGNDVFGKTLGLLGCGRIGQAVARRAQGFNMRLLAYDVAPSAEAEKLGVKFVSLQELLAESAVALVEQEKAVAELVDHIQIGPAVIVGVEPDGGAAGALAAFGAAGGGHVLEAPVAEIAP